MQKAREKKLEQTSSFSLTGTNCEKRLSQTQTSPNVNEDFAVKTNNPPGPYQAEENKSQTIKQWGKEKYAKRTLHHKADGIIC